MSHSGESLSETVLANEPSPESTDLIMRARLGDGAAWDALVQRYQQPAFRLAYLLLGDAAEAEDIAQETFLRVFRALDRYDTARPLLPWLLSIAANLARNRRRSIGRFFGALQRLAHENPGMERSDRNGQEQRWQSQALWGAVQRLHYGDQQVIYLRYFLELSVEETAQTMAIPTGTVKSRLHRAIDRLRTVIDREYPELREM